ncbi:AAA family ATPase [Phenylobacterium sp. J426]|uniref:replicative DNA helicase n=1 Tax=Phenylobacterium sp. J426 TaxID=2898439 RepID=UPI002151ED4C|nr:DnaB-like helicase C-terminal domain-containing protein [Phenylobacterium sp. J426]MCR5874383.1 AAA family ATPase [Phenylobacterium sp. J426]
MTRDYAQAYRETADAVAGDAVLSAPESERFLIGAALSGDEGVAELVAAVPEAHFTDDLNRRVWTAIQNHRGAGRAIDPGLVFADLRGDADLKAAGGLGFLQALAGAASIWAAPSHVEVLQDRALRRRIMQLTDKAREATLSELDRPAHTVLTDVERSVAGVLQQNAPDDGAFVDARAAARTTLARMRNEQANGKPRGLMTGLRCFDYRCRGLQPGWLIVLAGRPAQGKTALARSTAMSAARRNPDRHFIYFALEMDREELSQRSLSELSFMHAPTQAVPFFDMLGDLHAHDMALLDSLEEKIPANFHIEDAPVLSLEHIRRRLHSLKRRFNLGAVFVDYLQLMEKPPAHGRNEASVIGDITKGLKQLARELGICIVLLSQLNRGVEHREDKRPLMSDLLDSGKIEADANAIMLVYREVYYLRDKEPDRLDPAYREWEMKCEEVRRRMDIFMPKVRGGPAGREVQTYFAEYDHIEDPPQEGSSYARAA